MSTPDSLPATGDASNQLATFRRFAQLWKEQNRLKQELDEVEKQMAAMQETLLDIFSVLFTEDDEKQNFPVDGVTVFVRRDLYVRSRDGGAEGTAAVCRALHAAGMDHYCHETYNAQSLSSHVRELEKQNADKFKSGELTEVSELLPAELAEVVNCNPSYKVMGTRSHRE